jgi:hypothetical protein
MRARAHMPFPGKVRARVATHSAASSGWRSEAGIILIDGRDGRAALQRLRARARATNGKTKPPFRSNGQLHSFFIV